MPFGKSAVYSQAVTTSSRDMPKFGKLDDYRVPSGSAVRRHQFTKTAPDVGTIAPLASLFYFGYTLARFRRSFGAGVDDEPTPSGSLGNNYQTTDVMNGSRIGNYNATIKLTNLNANPITLTMYEIALSYFDAKMWEIVDNGACNQNTVTPSARGEVGYKTPAANEFGDNQVSLSGFRQRMSRKIGTITIGGTGNSANTVNLNINRVPPKCRRSNVGMFWAVIFANDASKNTYGDFTVGATCEIAFDEYPSANRLKWLE